MSLTPILALILFKKWRINFVGPLNPPNQHGRYQYIFVAIDYVIKWAKVVATWKYGKHVIIIFLKEKFYNMLWMSKEIGLNWKTHLVNDVIKELIEKYKIKHWFTSPYDPRTNGQTKKTNAKFLPRLSKTLWLIGKLLNALWVYRTAYKVTTKFIPFQLVYGQETILPFELELSSLRIANDERLSDEESL